jgi:hypothetical protein
VFLILYGKNNRSKSLKVIYFFILYSAFNFTLQYLIRELRLGAELFYIIVRLHFFVELAILAYFYQSIFKNSPVKKITLLLIPLFLCYSIFDYLVSSKVILGANVAIVESLMIMIILLYFFFEKIKYEVQVPLYESKTFWISVGLLVFFAGNFFLLVYSKALIGNSHFQKQYVTIYNSFNILKNLLICVALFIKETDAPVNPNKNPFDMLEDYPYPFNKQN